MRGASSAEIKEAEIKLRESKNFTEKISEASPGLVTVYNVLNGKYDYVNRAVTRTLGYSPEEFLQGGISFAYTLLHPDDIDRVSRENELAIQVANKQYPAYDENTIVEFEYRLRHEQGYYVWLHTYGVIFSRTDTNEVEKVLNISVDVTLRKNQEEEIRKTKEELLKLNGQLEEMVRQRTRELEIEKMELRSQTERNHLVDKATNDVIWDSDLVTNQIRYNENYQILFGYSAQAKLNSDSWMHRIHPADKERVVQGIDDLISRKGNQWSDEYRFIRYDGSSAHILDRGYIVYDESGKPVRMVGCMTDVSRLKQAEAEARANELKFLRIYQSNIIGMFFARLDGTFVDANKAFLDMLGYDEDDLKNGLLSRATLSPPEFNGVTLQAITQLKLNKVCLPFEKEYFHKNGNRISVLLGSALLEESDEETAVTYVIDITESKQAHLTIKRNEERFRFLANAIPQKVWTALPDGKINYLNKSWFTVNDGQVTDLDQLFLGTHKDDLAKTKILWNNALSTGEAFELEHRYPNEDGQYRWHLSRGIAQRDDSGKIILWVGTNTDIHDQKLFAEALQVSENYFRSLSDNVPFVIWKVDTNGMANYVNKSWIDFTGLSFEESLERGWLSALHPQDQHEQIEGFKSALEQQIPYYSKFRLRRADGEYRYMLNRGAPLFTPEFSGFIGSLTDVTEQEIEQQERELLMQQKDEFMSIASHELKTPITSMKAYLQIVERMTNNNEALEPIRNFISKANKQVSKLTSLVEDLLDITKIHAGKLILNKEYCKIGEIIEDCLDQVKTDEKQHRIDILSSIETEVYADKYRIEQVLINFLSNAIKYSPDSDRVNIKAEDLGDEVKVSVEDFGIGIPGDKLDYVFDRFFRVQESSQKFSGLGLGLYISSEIIARHTGRIGVESSEGRGSIFWFTLPKRIN